MFRYSISHVEGNPETNPDGHSRAMLIGYNTNKLSIYKNLFSQNTMRNPQPDIPVNNVDIANNVIYNWIHSGSYFDPLRGYSGYYATNLNYVNNYYKIGQNRIGGALQLRGPSYPGSSICFQGNVVSDGSSAYNSRSDFAILSQPLIPITNLEIQSANQAYSSVLENVGAFYWDRDIVDERIVNDVRNGISRIVDYNPPTGWPNIQVITRQQGWDTDRDGMHDFWEDFHCLDSEDSSDGSQYKISTIYTNVEVYLNELAGDFGGNLPSQCTN
jgi:hypothetical protein